MENEMNLEQFKAYAKKEMVEIEEFLKTLGFVFSGYEENFFKFEEEKEFPCYWFSYKNRNSQMGLRKLSVFLSPKKKHFDANFYTSIGRYLADVRFNFIDYLKYKKKPCWHRDKVLKSKELNEIFLLFKKELIESLSKDKELIDIVTGQVRWRNPPLEGIPKTDIKEFENRLDETLITPPPTFQEIGLFFLKKESTTEKSSLTDYRYYSFDYLYKNPKSGRLLKISSTPTFSAVFNCTRFLAYIEKGNTNSSFDLIYLEDYLKYKKKLESLRVLKSIDQSTDPLYDFINFICDLIIKDPIYRKIIESKYWEEVPNYFLMEYK